MNRLTLMFLAFVGGALLATQNGFNAQLGVILKHPLYATLVSFLSSAVFALIIIAVTLKGAPPSQHLKAVPVYLWFAGGLCTVAGLYLYYYTTPKIGISTMITLGLCGQLIFSAIAGHFGWFNLPKQAIDLKTIFGMVSLIFGAVLITNR
ncbi:DMT family transporter [Winogradskyella forsetii]|uniref:DMT family transporter n=1 Tax=Winogradskyella forsetii TaxID=2686077 RepID=UPI0015C72A82|nr:DMT family transporter [Winogradskyella forsetii]